VEAVYHVLVILEAHARLGRILGQPLEVGVLLGENGLLAGIAQLRQPVNHNLGLPLHHVVQCERRVLVDDQILLVVTVGVLRILRLSWKEYG